MRTPLISIAIATFNRAHLIPATLDSLLRQTLSDFEILIVDDQSTDDTTAVCLRSVATDSRIHYFRNEQRLGLARNCTKILQMTTGEFVVLAGDDDVYEPEYLARMLEKIRTDARIALVACRVDVIDQEGAFVRDVSQKYFESPASSQRQRADRMLWKGFGNLMTGMFRRDALMRTELFQSVYRDYWDNVDLVFLFDVALSGDIVWINDVLLHKRAGGVSARAIDRSFSATVVTFFMTWISFRKRLRRNDVSRWTAMRLTASIFLRMLVGLWEAKGLFAYSILVNVDRKGSLRGALRRLTPRSVMRKLEGDRNAGARISEEKEP